MIEHTNFVDKSLYTAGGTWSISPTTWPARTSSTTCRPTSCGRTTCRRSSASRPTSTSRRSSSGAITRENAAQPIIGLDYSKQIPSLKTPIEDLWLANTTQIYPEDRGTNYSVRLGRLMARILTGDAPNKMWWE